MALRYAVASGNWSSVSTWNGTTTLPGNGDTVVANGFTVTIDQDITIGGANNPSVNAGSFVVGQYYQITSVGSTSWTSIGATSNTLGVTFLATGAGSGTGVATALATLTTQAISPAVAGGSFAISGAYSVAADIRAGTTACVQMSGTSNVTWTAVNIIGSNSTAFSYGLRNTATSGTLSISGAFINTVAGTNSHAIFNSSTGTISITGCTIQSDGSSGNATGITNNLGGSITIDSSVITGTNAAQGAVNNQATGSVSISNSTITTNTTRNAVVNTSTGSLFISGSTITAGASTGIPVANQSTGTCAITTSTFTASATQVAFNGTSTPATVTIIQGSQFDNANGTVAVLCGRYKIGTTPSLMQYRKALDGTSTFLTLYTADFGVFGNPPISDVRSGVNYGGGGLIGTAAIPAAGSVALGVPVDATTGTAVLTAENVQTALTSYGASTLTKADITSAVIPLI